VASEKRSGPAHHGPGGALMSGGIDLSLFQVSISTFVIHFGSHGSSSP
jgi:hypothetical protein